MLKHGWIYVKRKAMVFGTVQNNDSFILFTLITLGSWVASWTLLPFYKSEFDPIFPYFRQSIIFHEMFTVGYYLGRSSLAFRISLLKKKKTQITSDQIERKKKKKKRVAGECHEAWGFKLCNLPDVWILFWKCLHWVRLELASCLLRHSGWKQFWGPSLFTLVDTLLISQLHRKFLSSEWYFSSFDVIYWEWRF